MDRMWKNGAGSVALWLIKGDWPSRQRRMTFFAQPLRGWVRVAAWFQMLVMDHTFFRYVFLNLHRVGREGWRVAQPLPHQFARFRKMGVKTVVSLRMGHDLGAWPLEVEACAREGLILREFMLRSRELLPREHLLALCDFLDDLEYPAIWHCKSGADRAGFMSAFYLIYREGASAQEAQKHLTLRYLHMSNAKTGVLDVFFRAYAADTAQTPMPLRTWIETRYDPAALTAQFSESRWSGWIVDRLLRRE